jgi:hypothetical protein
MLVVMKDVQTGYWVIENGAGMQPVVDFAGLAS